jgi:hypothetical protein
VCLLGFDLGFAFPHILASIRHCFPDDSNSDWGEKKSQCGFDLHFPGGIFFMH